MSGTSADGVDVAIITLHAVPDPSPLTLLHHEHLPYPAELRKRIFDIRSNGAVKLADFARLASDIAEAYATAVLSALRSSDLRADQIEAIAAHGQTLFHAPPLTLQWIDPALLAYRTNIAVVSDFRRADCAAGGQGAPLVPYADYILFRHATRNRILLNIGGIANLTAIPAGADSTQVTALDTGPGNCISDYLMRKYFNADFDADGQSASRGTANDRLVRAVIEAPAWCESAFKTTDVPQMLQAWEQGVAACGGQSSPHDLLASACTLTVDTIACAIETTGMQEIELIASGGGTRNATMMHMLGERLPDCQIIVSDQLGIPSEAKEAVAFALLGAATLDNQPGNVPSATGARRAVVLGSITPKP